MPQRCPLQTVGEEFGPTKVHAPFSLSDLNQIKVDLGNFSDDPDKYVDVLPGLVESFEAAWKDITLLLSQTLTKFGDTWYLSQVNDKMMPEKRERFPAGQQAIPIMDPQWDPDSEYRDWNHRHLLTCILKGLRWTRKKPMYYAMLSTITHGKEENSTAFLEWLWEALRKYTLLSPDSTNSQLILKDKFITPSAVDIRRKPQKLALGPE
ncbi:hypothetical protein AAY473_007893 [Plecturocebus cupreus]